LMRIRFHHVGLYKGSLSGDDTWFLMGATALLSEHGSPESPIGNRVTRDKSRMVGLSARFAARMTAHPGSPGEFETCPDWVPTMDSCQQFERITMKTTPVHKFDHSPVWLRKFETYPDWGAKLFKHLHARNSGHTRPKASNVGTFVGMLFHNPS
jgi:hypothetical protein